MRRVTIITFLLLISFTNAANAARKVQANKPQANFMTSGLVGYWSSPKPGISGGGLSREYVRCS